MFTHISHPLFPSDIKTGFLRSFPVAWFTQNDRLMERESRLSGLLFAAQEIFLFMSTQPPLWSPPPMSLTTIGGSVVLSGREGTGMRPRIIIINNTIDTTRVWSHLENKGNINLKHQVEKISVFCLPSCWGVLSVCVSGVIKSKWVRRCCGNALCRKTSMLRNAQKNSVQNAKMLKTLLIIFTNQEI